MVQFLENPIPDKGNYFVPLTGGKKRSIIASKKRPLAGIHRVRRLEERTVF
jgi:hypothetical protein